MAPGWAVLCRRGCKSAGASCKCCFVLTCPSVAVRVLHRHPGVASQAPPPQGQGVPTFRHAHCGSRGTRHSLQVPLGAAVRQLKRNTRGLPSKGSGQSGEAWSSPGLPWRQVDASSLAPASINAGTVDKWASRTLVGEWGHASPTQLGPHLALGAWAGTAQVGHSHCCL